VRDIHHALLELLLVGWIWIGGSGCGAENHERQRNNRQCPPRIVNDAMANGPAKPHDVLDPDDAARPTIATRKAPRRNASKILASAHF